MNTPLTVMGILGMIAVIALVISPATALFMHGDDCGQPENAYGLHRINLLLDHLEELEFDVTEIRNALENGDHETVKTLLQEFREAHADELPMPPPGERPCGGFHPVHPTGSGIVNDDSLS